MDKMENFFIKLERDPAAKINCSFYPGSATSPRNTLIICISGVDNPQTIWYPTITALQKASSPDRITPVLLYDRVGQGKSIGRAPDVPGRPKGHGRDCLDAAHDIRELVMNIGVMLLGFQPRNIDNLHLVLVGSSVGCAIARLYARTYPRTVVGLLLLDSAIANSDNISIFPDPALLTADDLSIGITHEMAVRTRKVIQKIYHPTAPNMEGLWRGNLPELLPFADAPKLLGPRRGTPFVTVVEHDHSIFAAAGVKLMGLPEILSTQYFDPLWQKYNIGLTKITEPHLSKGPIEAKGCNHLIQKDGPEFVANEIIDMLAKLRHAESSRL